MTEHGAPQDLIGPRVLVGVQLVDISRLSAHPVPLTHGGLITVAGQGPKDSNGAGKSSFIAALSLLHADEQWRLTGGAPGAAELLFTAELAAQEARWANADHGFVIGVFADPAATTAAELDADVLTVWLRINRKAPYLSLRWTPGLHVPRGANDAERAAGVQALWDALPHSNGRDDLHAGRLAATLYGGRVRCVSFLSTSVRAAPTANLLAQPLNELSPTRIFDALATLTGLDRELEQEQALRTAEHNRRSEVLEAERELARWQQEMAVVETGIARRQAARDILDAARAAWRSRCARHLVDGMARAAEIRHARAELDAARAERRDRLAELDERARTLADDAGFADRFAASDQAWRRLREQERDLETRRQRSAEKLDELGVTLRELTEQARAADGRTTDRAAAEAEQAQRAVEEVLARRGAAQAEQRRCADQLAAARAGEHALADQLRALADAGVPAGVVLRVLDPSPDAADGWQPHQTVPAGGLIVPALHEQAARKALAGRTDTTLVVAGEAAPDADGHAARVGQASEQHDLATDRLAQLDRELARARGRSRTASERVAAASAARQAIAIGEQIEGLRELAARLDTDADLLIPALQQAEAAHAEALGDRRARQDRIQAVRAEAAWSRDELRQADELADRLAEELDRLDLAGRQQAFGDGPAQAERHLLDLPEPDAARTGTEWGAETCHQLDDVTRRCFPDDTPAEQLPAELRVLLVEQRWRRLGPEARLAAVPDLIRALHSHLTLSAQQDAHDQRLIDTQRSQRMQDLAVAQAGLAEAQQSSQAYRTVLAQGVQARLTRVGAEFDRLDREYGGYGAGLDCPEPEPPAEPDKPWRWAVTPKWRRAEGQRMSGYNLRGNTAQMDEKAVKLVCAAALAGGDDRPLLLILDELGRNLGKQHRREAVALFERIGRDRNITVIGALQDDMERYAIEASNLYIKLRRSSDAIPYNEAPVVLGDETHRERIALLADWMSAYRPAPSAVGYGGESGGGSGGGSRGGSGGESGGGSGGGSGTDRDDTADSVLVLADSGELPAASPRH